MRRILATGITILGLWGWAKTAGAEPPAPESEEFVEGTQELLKSVEAAEDAGNGASSIPETDTGTTTNGVQAPVTSAVPVEVATPPPKEKRKALPPAAEWGQAFRTGRGSKFGLSSKQRSIKIPGKAWRAKKPKQAWRWKLELGADTASGNSDLRRYDTSLTGQKETDRNFFWLKLAQKYGKSDGRKDTQTAQADGRVEHRLNERDYTALDGQVLQDRIADLTYRARVNISLGHFFVQSSRSLLGMEIGPGYVREKKGEEVEGFLAGRVAQYAERLLRPNLLAWQSLEYIRNLETIAGYFLTAEAGLEAVLSPATSLRFSIQERYDNSPAEGKKRSDLTTTTSINWAF